MPTYSNGIKLGQRGGCRAQLQVGVRKQSDVPTECSPVTALLPIPFLVSLCDHGKKLQATQHANAAHEGSSRDRIQAG